MQSQSAPPHNPAGTRNRERGTWSKRSCSLFRRSLFPGEAGGGAACLTRVRRLASIGLAPRPDPHGWSQFSRRRWVMRFILGLILGAALGVSLGLLVAPQPGSETRRALRERMQRQGEEQEEE